LERNALASNGVRVQEPWEEIGQRDEQASFALARATSSVLLVCPEHDEAGRSRRLPALAFELGIDPRPRLEFGSSGPSRVRVSLRGLPQPRRLWRVLSSPRREQESPSSLSTLVACPLRWMLLYHARLVDRRTALVSGPVLNGMLAHDIVSRALMTPGCDPTELFDVEAPRLAAPLFLPGVDAERARVRAVIANAVRELREFLEKASATVVSSEVELTAAKGFVVPLKGRLDLVLGPRPGVLDLKWGSRRRHEDALARGTAVQLAVYAHLLKVASGLNALPPVGYYVLSAARLLAHGQAQFPGAWTIDGPPIEVTLEALSRAVAATFDSLDRGMLEARGIADDGQPDPAEAEDALTDGALSLAPPCRSCELDGLCGRAFRPGSGA
jgi:hypothetical protein